jgi:hypothetical protein
MPGRTKLFSSKKDAQVIGAFLKKNKKARGIEELDN